VNPDEVQLADLLRRLGGTDDEIAGALGSGLGGPFAVSLVLRTGSPVTVAAAAQSTGASPAEFLRLWRALGLATPEEGAAAVPADLLATLPVITDATQTWLGEDGALGLARVVGSTASRLAEALVDSFRVGFEMPKLSGGASYPDVVEQYVEITRLALPAFEEFLLSVIKAHIVRVASGAWSPDVTNMSARRDLFVAFVDLSGYTALAGTLSPAELASMLARFEDAVADVATTGGGRLVKLIGDGAMFVCDRASDGCLAALELGDRLGADQSLPPARLGADYGSVLSLSGDYYGDVVNRAARLVAVARPGTVVVSDSVAEKLDRNLFGLERLPAQALKGFGAPTVTYRLRGRGEGATQG
jgi:class 3 adenylate cyclase